MAYKFREAVFGNTDVVHTTAMHALGQVARDVQGREWIYMQGVASNAEGKAVTYDEAGVTTLLAANAKGPVAISGGDVDATTEYGWFCIFAPMGVAAKMAAASADNAFLGREGADGELGDGRAAGDEIYNMISRSATPTSGLGVVQMAYPFVDDVKGS
jgi:hypothetical protein